MSHHQDLIDKLKKIQHALGETKDLGVKHLEELGNEALSAFDHAMRAVDTRVHAQTEIKLRRAALKKWKRGFFRSIKFALLFVRQTLSIPFIYSMIIPALILHIFLEVYQQVCFRLYDIPRVRAQDYFIFDRARLPYLNWLEKINCLYCSYVNNLFRFSVEVGGRTERYWCPIKYANRMQRTHSQYDLFVGFLEADTFHERWRKLQDFSDLRVAKTTEKKAEATATAPAPLIAKEKHPSAKAPKKAP